MRDEDREVSPIRELMDNDPLNHVITFYAGLTKLKNKNVQETLIAVQNIKQDPVRPFEINTNMHDVSTDILGRNNYNSIYECQDRDLVKMYTPKVSENNLPPQIPHLYISSCCLYIRLTFCLWLIMSELS